MRGSGLIEDGIFIRAETGTKQKILRGIPAPSEEADSIAFGAKNNLTGAGSSSSDGIGTGVGSGHEENSGWGAGFKPLGFNQFSLGLQLFKPCL